MMTQLIQSTDLGQLFQRIPPYQNPVRRFLLTRITVLCSYVDTPPQSTRTSRKRTRDPSKWKQNIAKNMRNSGKAYVSCMTKKKSTCPLR